MPRWARIALGIGLGVGLLLGGVYVFRSEIATAATAFMLDRNDSVRCSHPTLEVASSLDRIDVSPLECSVKGGPMRRAETFGTSRVVLDGFSVKHVYVPRATFDFRERDVSHVETNTLGDLAGLVGASDSMIKGVLDERDSYSPDRFPMTVERITTLRDGKKDAVMYRYRKWMDGEWSRSHAARMSTGMEALAEVRNFDLRVTRTRARLTMGIYLGDAERGEEPDAEMRLESQNLNARQPKFELSMDDDESREARRVRRDEDSRAARQSKAPARD